jgi:Glycosyltransferases, probably involved in cell wall biogenesis
MSATLPRDPATANPPPALAVRVTVVIKALDEERHIRAAVDSALVAVARVGGEVVLADSGSTDRTVAIASAHPVTIVQLRHRSERRCGIGPQLGFQVARGEFVYILDGDMELHPDFLETALAAMAADPQLGGVAGMVEERSEASYQFRGRKRRGHEQAGRGDCEWLDMGGLYRTAALRAVGYFSNRNLHAFEELELGLRLRAAGWRMCRMPVPGVTHHGRPEGTWALLMRRWHSRYLDGSGELLRAAIGRPYFRRALRTQRHLLLALGVWFGLLAGVLALPRTPTPLIAMVGLVALLVGLRAWRARSLRDALLGQIVWQVSALALLRGLLSRPLDPATPVEYVVLSEPRRTMTFEPQRQAGTV